MNSEEDFIVLFNKACTFLTSITAETKSEDLLRFYSLYKQSVVGPCNTLRPGFFDFKGKQKWDAWKALNSMSRDEAMKHYINKLTELCPSWEEEANHMKSGWVSVSRMQPDQDVKEDDKTLFHFVQENNLDKVKSFNSLDLQVCDENKMTALHWACDRGYVEISQFLISNHLSINHQDIDGQTPLHYASSCGHESIVKLLLNNGAKTDIADFDGLLPCDVVENTQIKELFKVFSE